VDVDPGEDPGGLRQEPDGQRPEIAVLFDL